MNARLRRGEFVAPPKGNRKIIRGHDKTELRYIQRFVVADIENVVGLFFAPP